MRAFPGGFRIDSSNLEPAPLWRLGVQMVALNWQSCDAAMMLNEGMFAGQHGWTLKPIGYLGTKGKPSGIHQSIQRRTVDLKIELLAAQSLPIPRGELEPTKLRPYVKVELHIDGSDTTLWHDDRNGKGDLFKKRSRTGSSVNPDFLAETFGFPQISDVVEELSFVRYVLFRHPFNLD